MRTNAIITAFLFARLGAGTAMMKNQQNSFDQNFFQPTTTGKNCSSQDFFQPTTSGNTYPSQGETTSGERYSSFQDEQLPWDNAPQSRPSAQKDRSDFFKSNQEISSHAKTSTSSFFAPEQRSSSASHFRDTVPLPAQCEWIETMPYRVLEVRHKNYGVLIFGILWFAISMFMAVTLIEERGGMMEVLKLHQDLWFLLFPVLGIILTIAGIYCAFEKTWITCKANTLEIERGISRRGKAKTFYCHTACVEAFDNSSQYDRRRYGSHRVVFYKIKITDPDTHKSMTLIDNLDANRMHHFMDYIQYLLDR